MFEFFDRHQGFCLVLIGAGYLLVSYLDNL
jgi:hypothetical protein